MPIDTNNTAESYKKAYHAETKTILVLIPNSSGGAAKYSNYWSASQSFIAFVDLLSNQLVEAEGRLSWILSNEAIEANGSRHPYYFQPETIYKVEVRPLIIDHAPKGRIASFYNRFLVVNVLEQGLQHEGLLAILEAYKKPVEIVDERLGTFLLNKDLAFFEGSVDWLGRKVSVYIEVAVDEPETWPEAMATLRLLHEQQTQNDTAFRTYAGNELTALANDWQEDENAPKITSISFSKRIELAQLIIGKKRNFRAYFNDDDLFYGHVIDVSGNLDTGLSDATIAG